MTENTAEKSCSASALFGPRVICLSTIRTFIEFKSLSKMEVFNDSRSICKIYKNNYNRQLAFDTACCRCLVHGTLCQANPTQFILIYFYCFIYLGSVYHYIVLSLVCALTVRSFVGLPRILSSVCALIISIERNNCSPPPCKQFNCCIYSREKDCCGCVLWNFYSLWLPIQC